MNSCGTYQFNRTKEFTKLSSSTNLNAEYVAYSIPTKEQKNPTLVLPLFKIESSEVNYFKINLLDSKRIKLEYFDNNEKINKESVFEGKLKKKFFEIYFEKDQIIIPFLFTTFSVDRLRIGRDENDNLILMVFWNRGGNLLFIADSRSGEIPYLFKKSNQFDDLKPFYKNNQWGYKDSNGNIVIESKYDYTNFFYNKLAIVKKNGKYALINKEGNQLEDFEYDNLELKFGYDRAYYLVTLEGKKGVLDPDGKLVIPIEYDEIKSYSRGEFELELGNKKGFASVGNFIIPAIYDEIRKEFGENNRFLLKLNDKYGYSFGENIITPIIYTNISYYSDKFDKATRDDKMYFIDKQGYEYDQKETKMSQKLKKIFPIPDLVPDLSTKRKLEISEQNN